MAVDLKGRSFLTIMDFTPEEVRYMLDLAKKLKAQKKAGPNDPCPCGSGKKYKKCCMQKDKSETM